MLDLNPHHHSNPFAVLTMILSAAVAAQSAHVWRQSGGRYAYWIIGVGAILALAVAMIAGRVVNGYWL